MEKIIGIGGVFFKADDADSLRKWYAENLGVAVDPSYGGAMYDQTAWTIMKRESKYFAGPFMVNYRVSDLDAMLAQLRAAGASVDDKVDDSEFGRFGWATDPEGNRIELWQPPVKTE